MLRATEAAVVSGVTLREVNRVIDEGILPEEFFTTDDGRHVQARACPLISFYFASAKRLTSEERLLAIRQIELRLQRSGSQSLAALLKENWTVVDDFLAIDLAPFVKQASERLGQLDAAQAIVTSSPEILGGTPVISGTRIPIHDVAASAAAGIPMARILAAYPALDSEKVGLARLYAEANPLRGRPAAGSLLPRGAVVKTDRRVPRRT
jgi:uncharacterized protein (DUF433 family)